MGGDGVERHCRPDGALRECDLKNFKSFLKLNVINMNFDSRNNVALMCWDFSYLTLVCETGLLRVWVRSIRKIVFWVN